MDRCDEVFQRVYETMFEQTDDPLPDVVPVTRELRCQMLQQHLRHSSQRLMQRCGVDRSDADLQRISARVSSSCGAWNAQFCSAVPGRFGARRRALATIAAEDERCGNAANYAYDTMIGLFSTCVFRPPFLDSHEECGCCIMKFTAPGDLYPPDASAGRRPGTDRAAGSGL